MYLVRQQWQNLLYENIATPSLFHLGTFLLRLYQTAVAVILHQIKKT
jgi:hypothetical protein